MINTIARFTINTHYRLYRSLATWRRVRNLGVHLRSPLTFEERNFYLSTRCALLGSDLVIYDIGASTGIYASCVAKLANVKSVHAFEPIRSSFEELERNMRPFPHVTCHNVACGEQSGVQDMFVVNSANRRDSSSLLEMNAEHKRHYTGDFEAHGEKVTIVRLDDFVVENALPLPDVIKIDVQGFEDRVLRGGLATMAKSQFLVLEASVDPLYEGSTTIEAIYDLVHSHGFRLIGLGDSHRSESGRLVQADFVFENLRKQKNT